MHRSLLLVVAALAAAATFVVPSAANNAFPTEIELPNGFAPEGIAIGRGTTFYVGSIPTGAVYRGNLRTGRGAVLVPGREGRAAIGVAFDRRGRLFVAGGPTGRGFVYDARTGADRASYQFATTPPDTFVNDVALARGGAYFTDSNRPVLYRVPIAANGRLGAAAQTVPLTGDLVYEDGFNVNGIDATRNGKTLILVQSNTGELFTANPRTGVTREIDLGGATVTMGDGILLDGRTLYVVRNRANLIAVVRLAPSLRSGRVVRELTNPRFMVPTTIDDLGRRIYAVNARFGTPVTPDTEYWVTQVRKPRGS
jgi:sugar lactone lactonase YvrE